MELNSNTTITRCNDLLVTDIDGETVLMSIERGSYYGLEKTARRLWELLETPCRFGELCERLAREYAAPVEVIEADVRAFVLDMTEERLVLLT